MKRVVKRRLEERRVAFESLFERYVCGLDKFEKSGH